MVSERAAERGDGLVLVLGEMLEMGAQAAAIHHEIGAVAGASGARAIAFIGSQSAAYEAGVGSVRAAGASDILLRSFETSDEASPWVVDTVKAGDMLLLKGSRGLRVERVREALVQDVNERAAKKPSSPVLVDQAQTDGKDTGPVAEEKR